MRWTWGSWFAVLTLASGCQTIDFGQFAQQHAARSRVLPEPAGVHCERGGQALQTGLDLNDNGQLDNDEVTATEYACTSAPATVRTRNRTEPAGANCERGGRAVETGLDLDGDGQLQDGEVTATEYVCATAAPDVLVRTRQVPPGEKCPNGGQVSHAGLDTNGNGLLEDGEITREVYGCTQSAPVLARTRVLTNTLFCQFGGVAVDAGEDVDADGVLDEAEVQATAHLCGIETTPDVLTRLKPEPAGSRCPVAGTKVEAGQDRDVNGQLDNNEVSTSAYVCQPARTYDGTFVVRTPADLAALQGVTRIHGGLLVQGEALTEVVLPGLRVVEGPVRFLSNPVLTRAELGALRFVGDDLVVSSNPKLDTLVMGGATFERVWVASDLNVSDNAALTSLWGLMDVTPGRDIILSNNDALEEPGSIYYVDRINGSLTVRNNDALRTIPFPNLQYVGGGVDLSNNDALESLSALGTLRTVGGNFAITGNDALLNLDGMSGIGAVGALSVVDNAHLKSTAGFSQLAHAGTILFSDNPELETAGDLPGLQRVDSGINIERNPKLVTVAGFQALESVGPQVSITDNPLLADVTGFEKVWRLERLSLLNNDTLTSLSTFRNLHDVAELQVSWNGSLTRLDDLSGLVSVSSHLEIRGNPVLATCQATSFADRVFTGTAPNVFIFENDDTGTCGP